MVPVSCAPKCQWMKLPSRCHLETDPCLPMATVTELISSFGSGFLTREMESHHSLSPNLFFQQLPSLRSHSIPSDMLLLNVLKNTGDFYSPLEPNMPFTTVGCNDHLEDQLLKTSVSSRHKRSHRTNFKLVMGQGVTWTRTQNVNAKTKKGIRCNTHLWPRTWSPKKWLVFSGQILKNDV